MQVRRLFLALLVASLSSGALSCSGEDGTPSDALVAHDNTRDVALEGVLDGASEDARMVPDAVEVTPDLPLDNRPELSDVWDPSICGLTCPQGFCDNETGRCLYCTPDLGCNYPQMWCRDNRCVQTLCVPETRRCASVAVAQLCNPDGESYTDTICEEGQACHSGECLPIICEPGDSHCVVGKVEECSPDGTGWLVHGCPMGEACFTTQCQPIQHNLLVVFDTSGSMASGMGVASVPCICASCPVMPYPACEDPMCPNSKLGMAKHVFEKFFDSELIKSFSLVLTRFPLRIKVPEVTNCNDVFALQLGYYGMSMTDADRVTGDDGVHQTSDGDWFDTNMHEILCTPFPRSWAQDNLAEAQLWVNFDEKVAPTETSCSAAGVNAECPGGFCAPNNLGEKVCWYHTDPELRAITGTPLGRSLFYAGEVYRKEIKVDGRPCTTHTDCENRNYFCTNEGKCKDPMGHCRVNMIVVFTDGMEDPPTTTSEFFNPEVQAKRFRYGLGCNADEDCFEGAICEGGRCSDYPQPNGGGSSVPPNTELPWRLMDYNDNPILVTTHMIDVSDGEGIANNQRIADAGGGTYFHASDMDPDELLNQLLSIIDIKQNLLNCIPDWEGIDVEGNPFQP